jgi:uncharacterized delta-60 repeat protein
MTRRPVRALLAVALAAAVLTATPGSAVAAAGDFDPSFGTAGVATAPPSGTLPSTGANSLAVDGSGRFVTVGSTFDTTTSQYVFTVHRFLPTGAIDADFGDDGLAIVPMTTGWSVNTVTGVGVQPDGRIVLGARVYPTATPNDGRYGVVRLTASGVLDTDFDGGVAANGILMLTVGPGAGSEVERRLSVDETGRILVSGGTYYTGPTQARATMARLNPDGTFDATFSGDGKFDLLLPTSDSDLKGFADLPGTDGYALGGRTIPNTAPTIGQPTIVRVSEAGELVTGFTSGLSDTPGRSTTYWQADPTKLGEITTLAGLPGGAILAGGYQNPGKAALARYTPTGALDPAFGTNGVTLLQIGGGASSVNDLVPQPDGKILAAMSGTDANHGFVARFTATGELDPAFGTGGVVDVGVAGGTEDIVRQGDGKVVAIVRRGLPDTTLVRLLGDPAPSPVIDPTVQVTSPAGKTVKAKKLKSLAGTAGPAGAVTQVRVALQRVDKPLLKEENRCLWLANHRGRFKEVKATGKKCSTPVYRKAKGMDAWKYALRNPLVKGRYVLYAQVLLGDGRSATVRKKFRVTD